MIHDTVLFADFTVRSFYPHNCPIIFFLVISKLIIFVQTATVKLMQRAKLINSHVKKRIFTL